MKLPFLVGCTLVGAALLAGCGPSCQEACNRAFKENECNLSVPGATQNELARDCISECESALRKPGDLDGYDPNERHTSGESIRLENERQAAVWMDCVVETACERLDQGYCAGGGI